MTDPKEPKGKEGAASPDSSEDAFFKWARLRHETRTTAPLPSATYGAELDRLTNEVKALGLNATIPPTLPRHIPDGAAYLQAILDTQERSRRFRALLAECDKYGIDTTPPPPHSAEYRRWEVGLREQLDEKQGRSSHRRVALKNRGDR